LIAVRRKLLAACALLLVTATGLLLALQYARFASTFEARARDRQVILARDLAQAVEAHLALGLGLSDAPALARAMAVTRSQAPDARALGILDARGQVVLADVAPGVDSARLAPVWALAARRALASQAGQADGEGLATVALPLSGSFGERAGTLVLSHDEAPARRQTAQAFAALWPTALAALAAALALLVCTQPVVAASRVNRRRSGGGLAQPPHHLAAELATALPAGLVCLERLYLREPSGQ
jgi:hypothetical protein